MITTRSVFCLVVALSALNSVGSAYAGGIGVPANNDTINVNSGDDDDDNSNSWLHSVSTVHVKTASPTALVNPGPLHSLNPQPIPPKSR